MRAGMLALAAGLLLLRFLPQLPSFGWLLALALVGLLLLLLASLGGMAAGILPMWMVRSGDFSAVSSLSAILGVLHFALAMVEAIGVVLVVWALVRLLRTRTLPAA